MQFRYSTKNNYYEFLVMSMRFPAEETVVAVEEEVAEVVGAEVVAEVVVAEVVAEEGVAEVVAEEGVAEVVAEEGVAEVEVAEVVHNHIWQYYSRLVIHKNYHQKNQLLGTNIGPNKFW
jgi:hypothetical protein